MTEKYEIELCHGDNIRMLRDIQSEFKHSIPRQKNKEGRRISVSFRQYIKQI
jgi:hypothetical protein